MDRRLPDMAHAHEQTVVYEYELERRDAEITGSGVYREPTPGPDPPECDVPLDVEGMFEPRRPKRAHRGCRQVAPE